MTALCLLQKGELTRLPALSTLTLGCSQTGMVGACQLAANVASFLCLEIWDYLAVQKFDLSQSLENALKEIDDALGYARKKLSPIISLGGFNQRCLCVETGWS